MEKKILITENEKNRILNLYGILKNQLNEASNKLTPIDVTVNFASGCHSNKGGNKCLPNQVTTIFTPYIEQIKTFLKSSPKNEVVQVVLSASESKVPNRDGELPKGKDGLHPKLEQKILSQKRYSSIEAYLTNIFTEMLNNGEITKMPEFVKNEVLIGGPDWDKNKGKDHDDYKQHQYLNAIIKLKEKPVPNKPKPPVGLSSYPKTLEDFYQAAAWGYVLTGAYFCNMRTSQNMSAAWNNFDTCSQKTLTLDSGKKHTESHMSAFEIKWQFNDGGRTSVRPVLRWKIYWDETPKITKIMKQYVDKREDPNGIFLPEEEVALDDPLFMLAMKGGNPTVSDKNYEYYITPHLPGTPEFDAATRQTKTV